MMARLVENKVALITGAGSGIGRASALAFAREGAKVVVADVSAEGGNETVRLVEEAGGKAMFVKTDVSKATEVEALIQKIVQTYGRLDCAHNNAGIEGIVALTADYPEEMWDRVLRINLKGAFLSMKHEIPQMLKQGGGAIVNTASGLGIVGIQGLSAYVASKGGVVGLTRTAAVEYAPSGIRINALIPGVTRTPMMTRQMGENAHLAEPQYISLHPIGRLGLPEEIAEAAVWLCSEHASFVVGHAMAIDGGYLVV
jgi:NAD(P)-dependent dehydrogenase (short-subunit alcohol dehydrogenase family)